MQRIACNAQLQSAAGRETGDRQARLREAAATDWRRRLPTLSSRGVTLRELAPADAPSLLAFLGTPDVSQFLTPPPATVEGFERFIAWTHAEREAGSGICFGIVPDGYDVAAGMIQFRSLEPAFVRAEWGFALGSAFWGTGLFVAGAALALEFAFETLGVHRLEARSVIQNGRGNAVLRKLGAVQEGILRQSFLRHGHYYDQVLWAILAADWRQARVAIRPTVH